MKIKTLIGLLRPQDYEGTPCPVDSTPMIQYGFYLHELWCPRCKTRFTVNRIGDPLKPLKDVREWFRVHPEVV